MSDVVLWLGVGILGGLASIARFWIGELVSARRRGPFPFGTFVVNVSGAAVLGLVTGWALTGDALLVVGTATLGSYTTFSTWMFESHRLAQDGEVLLAVVNLLASVALGIAGVVLGRWIGG